MSFDDHLKSEIGLLITLEHPEYKRVIVKTIKKNGNQVIADVALNVSTSAPLKTDVTKVAKFTLQLKLESIG